MRKARLLSTVAATLLLTVGVASAQTMKSDEAPARAPAAQQNAPAEKIAPALKTGERKTPETTGQAPAVDKAQAPDKGAMDKKKDSGAAAKASPDANGSADVKAKTKETTAQSTSGPK